MQKTYIIILLVMLFSSIVSAQSFVRAKQLGGADYDEGKSIAVDGSGNVYTTGIFRGTVDFDPGAETYNFTSAGATDIFILFLLPN